MAQKTISTRISKETGEEPEEIKKVERALDLFKKGKITFNKAAEVAGISVWELADILKEKEIKWTKVLSSTPLGLLGKNREIMGDKS